jgi:hypothetical protein
MPAVYQVAAATRQHTYDMLLQVPLPDHLTFRQLACPASSGTSMRHATDNRMLTQHSLENHEMSDCGA